MKILKVVIENLPAENRRRWLPLTACGLFLLSLLLLPASTLMIKSRSVRSEAETIATLKKSSQKIRTEFSHLLSLLEKRKAYFQNHLPGETPEEIFLVFQKSGLEKAHEGVAWLAEDLTPLLWLGNTANLKGLAAAWPEQKEKLLPGSFVVQDRASFYLVSLSSFPENHYLAIFELLAFQPQFQSTYLREFIRLKSINRSNADINFWDFQQDTGALEKFFSRTQTDEYLSQQTEEVEIRTLYFPLRNEQRKIVATVTLNSLKLQKQMITLPFLLRLSGLMLLIISLLLAVYWLYSSGHLLIKNIFCRYALFASGLVIIRLLFSLLTVSPPFSRLRVFSPQDLGLDWPAGLASSPASFSVSCLLFFALSIITVKIFIPETISNQQPDGLPQAVSNSSILRTALLASGSVFAFFLVALLTGKIVSGSSLNLLSFPLNLSAILIYLSLFLLLAALLSPPLLLMRKKLPAIRRKALLLAAYFLPAAALLILLKPLFRAGSQEILITAVFWLLFSGLFLARWKTLIPALLSLLLVSGFAYFLLREFTATRSASLTENVMAYLVSSQKSWARMALQQSFAELNRRSRDLYNYFRRPNDGEFARSLWNLTPLARFNWNSCLYLQNQELKLLSSFALNLPVFAEQTNDLPISTEPVIEDQYLDILGQEKHFLVGYQDFSDAEGHGGRLVIWVSLDPELLPFFYSANPYFELLRLNILPSLQHFPVSLAIFDRDGRSLFQQEKPGLTLPASLRKKAIENYRGFWSEMREGKNRYRAFLTAPEKEKICVFYLKEKSWPREFTDFLKIFYLFFIFTGIGFLPHVLRKKRWQLFSQSFSFRVYLAFLAAGLIPLFFFIFFSQTIMSRIFAERFVQEATSRAYFARSILHDFISLQEQAEPAPAPVPEELVFWISSTLNNDVNLYRNGLLLSSSRREYFETGILSEMLDGEIYFRLRHQQQPLVVSRKSFGNYFYRTVTIPYRYLDDVYFLNLPFPFEKQEISATRRELLEFFLFVSIFIILLIAFLVGTIRRMVVTPINRLIKATRAVGLGNLDVRVEYRAGDELQSLIDGFNAMVENLKAHEKELAELSQRVAWTEMARKVAHEIKNPLTPIQLSAEHILKVHSDRHPDFDRILQESISYIISEVENLRRIASEFMTIARESGLVREKFDFKKLLQDIIGPLKEAAFGKIEFRLKTEGKDFRLFGDRGKLKVAIRNIVINAIEAIRDSGRIDIILRAKNGELELQVVDTGCGIPEEVLNRIFEPYFSTKEKGTGLGLAICRRIVEEHQGSIRIQSQPGRGTAVTIVLPRGFSD
ncbi:MAG: ATP-binding protein [Candidatus Saccharicenans sp.]